MPRGRNWNVYDDWLDDADEAVAHQHLLAAREHYRQGAEELWQGGLHIEWVAKREGNVVRRTLRDTAEEQQARLNGGRGSDVGGALGVLREKAAEPYNLGKSQVNILRSQLPHRQLYDADPCARSFVRRRKSRLEAAIDGATPVDTAAATGTGLVHASQAG
ncbi:hypothetical protein JCM1841_002549 [Sporobolomyces salmonicolor]